MQIARTEYLVTDGLIPDATSKAWLGRRDILPPRLLSAPRPSPRRVNRERHPRKAPRSMKMGTIRSPWHYDAARGNFLLSAWARHSRRTCCAF